DAVNLLPRSGTVLPDELAGELLGLLVLGLKARSDRTGAVASPRLQELLYALLAGDLRHHGRGTCEPASLPAGPSTLDSAEVVSVAEAADGLGCSRQWVRWLIGSGRLRARRSGWAWLIDAASLDAYRYDRKV